MSPFVLLKQIIKEERVRKVHEHYQHVMSTAMKKKTQRQAGKDGRMREDMCEMTRECI